MTTNCKKSLGFTLIEMVMVIVILGVIGAMVAVFMKAPIDAYFDTGRRAALTDVADTATRRMARDLRKALPNSIRNPNPQCLEFIPTKTGGRYRAEELVFGDGTSLNFSGADATFNILGANNALSMDQRIVVGDLIAVYNLGILSADAYASDNTAAVTAVANGAETTITIAPTLFPLASGGNRFHVVPNGENVVSYVCTAGNLRRSIRGISDLQCPTTGPILAKNVATCNFVYNSDDLQRNALVQLSIALTDAGETVSLYHEVHVDNTP